MQNKAPANNVPLRQASRGRRRESGPGPGSPAKPAGATKDSKADLNRAVPPTKCTGAERCRAGHIETPRRLFRWHSAPAQPIRRSTRPSVVQSRQDCLPPEPRAKSGKLKAVCRAERQGYPTIVFRKRKLGDLQIN